LRPPAGSRRPSRPELRRAPAPGGVPGVAAARGTASRPPARRLQRLGLARLGAVGARPTVPRPQPPEDQSLLLAALRARPHLLPAGRDACGKLDRPGRPPRLRSPAGDRRPGDGAWRDPRAGPWVTAADTAPFLLPSSASVRQLPK